jgi:hypothetical protein
MGGKISFHNKDEAMVAMWEQVGANGNLPEAKIMGP